MYYFIYFLKCCIRNLARLICKPKILFTILAIILLLFCFGKLEVHAAEKESLKPEYLENRTITGTIDKNSPQGQISDFGGFYIFFAPISYKGQKVGYNLETSQTCEVRYGFAEYVTPGTTAYFYGQETTSQIGNLSTHNNLESPIGKGFFVVCVYQGYAVTKLDMYTMDTVQDNIALSTTEIIENNDNNTQLILDSQQEMTDKITEGQEQISNDLTNTDYDENTISVDTSSLDDLHENEDILNYPMQLVQKLTDIVNDTNWDTVDVIDVGIPYTDKKIQLRSDMLYNFINDTGFYNVLYVFWVYIFGRYMIHFGLRIYHWLRTGEAVRKSFNVDGEAITAALM